MAITMKAWFRALAASLKSEATAQAVAGMSILVLVLYTGYAIPQPSMIGALRWISYINVRLVPCCTFVLYTDPCFPCAASSLRFRRHIDQ
jgi:ABC-type multidrug transport system permease subunit